ncbi:MFS transporter [Phragmitibacter flavus]|nr:MFS transporter [Phragmitibacter flavus]
MSPPQIAERPLLFLLAAVQFTHLMDFMVMMPLGPQLMRLFEIAPDQFSLLVAVYTFSAAIAGVAGALFVDRFDRRTALLFTYGGFILGTLACALAPGYHSLLVARAISGAFGGVAGSLVLTIIGDVVPPERRGRAIGVVMAAFSLASVVGVPVGLWLAAQWSWHAPFLMIVGTGLMVWAAVWGVLPRMRAHMLAADAPAVKVLAGVKELLSNRNSRTALGFMMMMVFGHFILIPFLSPSLVSNAGLMESELFWFYLAGGIASLFSAPLIGRMADRFGKKWMFAVTIVCGAVPVYFIANLGPTSLPIIIILAAVFFMFAGGRFVPGQAIITGSVPPRLRGSFMSLNNSVRDFAAGAASLIGGQIIVKDLVTGKLLHLPVLGWIAITVSLLSMVLMSRVKPVS